jgi:hypothetical protein
MPSTRRSAARSAAARQIHSSDWNAIVQLSLEEGRDPNKLKSELLAAEYAREKARREQQLLDSVATSRTRDADRAATWSHSYRLAGH